MKTGFKHGLGLFAGLVFSVAAMAREPIVDKDAFEKQYIGCIMSEAKINCFLSIFLGHLALSDSKEQEKIVSGINENWTNVLPQCHPYKVHKVDKTLKADISDSRSYIIECSDDSFIGFYINFRRIKDKWYVGAIKLDKANAFVHEILNTQIMSNENAN